jgi:hypothetical protein
MRAAGSRFIGLAAVLAASCLAGCNSSTSGSDVTTTQSATGIWAGTDSVTNLQVTGIINSGGQATFIRSDGVQFAGTVDVSGTTLAATVTGYTNFNQTFSDGSTYGIGTLNGTVSTGSSLTATLTFTTNGGTALTGSWSLSFETLSNSASSTGAVQGSYADIDNTTLAIASNGVMSEQNTTTGCVLNGSISTNDSSVNVYQVSYTLSVCTGTYAPLNGVQFTGLAYLDTNNAAQVELVIAVAGASSTSKYAIVSDLNLIS